jgi:hypothetical protein
MTVISAAESTKAADRCIINKGGKGTVDSSIAGVLRKNNNQGREISEDIDLW